MARDDGPAPRWPPPRKRLGQHFLTDPRILTRIADALGASAQDVVVEIGPGRGALTAQLLMRAGRVVAIELDRALAAELRTRYANEPRLSIIERDVLEVSLAEAAGTTDYLAIGNVPYYITTPILFHLLQPPRPRGAVLLVQREVAERIIASAGTPEYGALSVNVQAVADATISFTIPAGAFSPPPKVDSAVVRLAPRANPVVVDAEQPRYAEFVIAAFGLRRKQMRRVLRTLTGLPVDRIEAALGVAGVAPDARPEVLTPEQFAALHRLVSQRRG
jgi:16S rRNA (adenine1518-N6/adenine1519-N6)-dimethyltransferase